MADKTTNNAVKKVTDTITKDLPNLVKENKGAAIGAVIGYLFSDAINEKENVVTALIGGLVGNAVDNKKKEQKF